MTSLGRAFSLLIAIHVQIIALLFFAIVAGNYLNEHYPKDFNWLVVTLIVGGIAIVQTVYVVIKVALKQQKKREEEAKAAAAGGPDRNG